MSLHFFSCEQATNSILRRSNRDDKKESIWVGRERGTVPYYPWTGSVTFWYGPGSSDPDLAPYPDLFISDLQDTNKNLILKNFCSLLFKVHLHHSSQIKGHKEVTTQQKSRFSYYFCLMMGGSGSRRSKNLRTLRIWIRNTGTDIMT